MSTFNRIPVQCILQGFSCIKTSVQMRSIIGSRYMTVSNETKAKDLGWNPSHDREKMNDSLTDDQVRKIGERTHKEFFNHLVLKTSVPESSLPPEGVISKDEIRRKRILYRSKQRGWLEVDVLLGTFAEQNLMTMSNDDMDEYEAILNCETIDIYNYISGIGEVPSHLNTNMLRRLREHAYSSPLGATPESYADAKKKNKLI